MFYECETSNCGLGPEICKNRPFAELEKRVKSNNMYDIGVEIVKTVDKGFGVRSMRNFEGGQLIMEYTGEIITQEECDRRVNEDYKDNEVISFLAKSLPLELSTKLPSAIIS